jgi:replicative DNA helicase
LSDLRDSGSIEQDADAVMLMWPVRELGNDAKLIGMDAAKNRLGRSGEFALHFSGDTQTWGQSTESTQSTAHRCEQGGRRVLGQYD